MSITHKRTFKKNSEFVEKLLEIKRDPKLTLLKTNFYNELTYKEETPGFDSLCEEYYNTKKSGGYTGD